MRRGPQERLDLWDRLKAKADAEVAAKEPQKITVTLPDGKEVEGQSWRTTPYYVAKGIRSVADDGDRRLSGVYDIDGYR